MKILNQLKERIDYACKNKDGAYINSPNMLAIKAAYTELQKMESELRIYRLKDICFPGSFPELYNNYITIIDDDIYDSLYRVLKKYNHHTQYKSREYNYLRNKYIIKKYISMYNYIDSVIKKDIQVLKWNAMLDEFIQQMPHKANSIINKYEDTILIDDINDVDKIRAQQIKKWCGVLEKFNFNKQYKNKRVIKTISIR